MSQLRIGSIVDEDLAARVAQTHARSLALAWRLVETAASIEATELEVARVHEEIARNGVSVTSAQAAEHALRARRFAEQEQQAQRRWAQQAAR